MGYTDTTYQDLDRLERAIKNTGWEYACEKDPMRIELIGSGYTIRTYDDDIEGYCSAAMRFRRHFHYRSEAWLQAEVRRDNGRLKVNNTFKEKLSKKFKVLLKAVELEQNLLKEVADKQNLPEPIFTVDDARDLVEIGEKSGWLYEEALSKSGIIRYYRPTYDDCPDINCYIPVVGFNVSDCLDDVVFYYENFDVEREIREALTEKYGIDDVESPEAEEIKEQVLKAQDKLFRLYQQFLMYPVRNFINKDD